MNIDYKPTLSSILRLLSVSVLLFAATALAFASKGGGGGDKKKHHETDNAFTPIHASTFTLKRAPLYSGSMVSIKPETDNHVSLNANVTYQRGNTILILPYNYKVNISPMTSDSKSNLQFLGVKIHL